MLPRLHLVTDDAILADAAFADAAAAVLARCGPDVALHLRGHDTAGARLYQAGEMLAAAALRSGAWLLVNDRVDVALAVRAQGVQLGARSLPIPDARVLLGAGAHIGYSAHAAEGAERAVADGADFIVAGTIWESASHPSVVASGTALLGECARRTRVPVLAIGGVTPARVSAAAAADAYGVAVLSGVWRTADPPAAATTYLEAVRSAWNAVNGA